MCTTCALTGLDAGCHLHGKADTLAGVAQLILQLGPVGDEDHLPLLEFRVAVHLSDHEHHGHRLARSLGMPDHAAAFPGGMAGEEPLQGQLDRPGRNNDRGHLDQLLPQHRLQHHLREGGPEALSWRLRLVVQVNDLPAQTGELVQQWLLDVMALIESELGVNLFLVNHDNLQTSHISSCRFRREFLHRDPYKAVRLLAMFGDVLMVRLDLPQDLDIEILLTAEIAFHTRHILHEQHVLIPLVEITGGLFREVLITAEGALLGHGQLPRS